jgi:hypothetical protein
VDLDTFIVTIFCLVEDALPALVSTPIRQRGPAPTLADSEVLTILIVGAYVGLATDVALYRYFCRHFAGWFPALPSRHRTTFARQAANLWPLMERLHGWILQQLPVDPTLSFVDSFPIPVCRFARAYRCQRLRGIAAFGYDDVARQRFYGLRGHVRVSWPGVIVVGTLAAANVHDVWVAEAELLPGACGQVLADRNYWSPRLRDAAAAAGVDLIAPRKTNRQAPHPWPAWLIQVRRRVETVISQLVERYQSKRVWARDQWHLTGRWWRKVLSHTICVYLCGCQGLEPLRLSELVT